MRASKVTSVILSALWALSACESTLDETEPLIEDAPRQGASLDTVCLTGGPSGFYQVGDRAIVMCDGPNKSYLVETGFCPNINQPEGLRIVDESKCLRRGDRIEVFDTAQPRRGSTLDRLDMCTIIGIFSWTEHK